MTSSYSMQRQVECNGDNDDYYYLEGEDHHDTDWEPILAESGCDSDSDESEEEISFVDSDDSQCNDNDVKAKADSCLPSTHQAAAHGVSSARIRPAIQLCILLSLLLLLALAIASTWSFSTVDFHDGLESLYIPGLGFSGFWFALGRLKSIPDKASKHYVCFSAGCLGTVAILNDFSVEEMACTAQTLQNQWKQGQIDRFQVVSQFVHGLVYREFDGCIQPNDSNSSKEHNVVPIDNPNLFSKVHILTTELSTTGPQAIMRSPTNLEELRDMLIQTAWIPQATGNGLTHNGHMDGGFSFWQHPRCTKSVNLPLDLGLIFNSLNVNMPVEEAFRLWNSGLAYGM